MTIFDRRRPARSFYVTTATDVHTGARTMSIDVEGDFQKAERFRCQIAHFFEEEMLLISISDDRPHAECKNEPY